MRKSCQNFAVSRKKLKGVFKPAFSRVGRGLSAPECLTFGLPSSDEIAFLPCLAEMAVWLPPPLTFPQSRLISPPPTLPPEAAHTPLSSPEVARTRLREEGTKYRHFFPDAACGVEGGGPPGAVPGPRHPAGPSDTQHGHHDVHLRDGRLPAQVGPAGGDGGSEAGGGGYWNLPN